MQQSLLANEIHQAFLRRFVHPFSPVVHDAQKMLMLQLRFQNVDEVSRGGVFSPEAI